MEIKDFRMQEKYFNHKFRLENVFASILMFVNMLNLFMHSFATLPWENTMHSNAGDFLQIFIR